MRAGVPHAHLERRFRGMGRTSWQAPAGSTTPEDDRGNISRPLGEPAGLPGPAWIRPPTCPPGSRGCVLHSTLAKLP